MKLSAGFDPRRLRNRGYGRWRQRLCMILSALLFASGLVVLVNSLLIVSNQISASTAASSLALGGLVLGIILAWFGLWLWRRCRRRSPAGALDFAPHLLKRR